MKKRRPTHYDMLEVSRTASEGVIRAAYRSLSQKHHPDIAVEDSAALARMTDINAAYAVLSNPARRTEYDKSLGLSSEVSPLAMPLVPSSGWGRSSEGRWRRFVRGWVEYAITNDTGDHAWVGLSDGKGRVLRTVFVRSGEAARVIISACPAHLTVSLGRVWAHESMGFAPEHRLWRTSHAIRPPGSRMRLDVSLSGFAKTGRFETLDTRARPSPLPAAAPSKVPGPSGLVLALATVSMLAVSLWGVFVLEVQWALLAAGVLGMGCAWALGRRWARSGHRMRAALIACLASSAVWAGASWKILSVLLQGSGWSWSPLPMHMVCWIGAALGPSALAWRAWASQEPRAPAAAWGALTLFCGAALAALWGSVFGWGASAWSVITGTVVPESSLWAAATCLAVAWSSIAWAVMAVMANVITRLGERAFNPWTSAYWRLLAAWAMLPVIAVAALPHLSQSWWRSYMTWFVRAIPWENVP